jgi:hypothetical protein
VTARRVLVVALLAATTIVVCGANSYQPLSWSRESYRVHGVSYPAGGAAKVDTFRIWSRVTSFPNKGAIAAGYIDSAKCTTINSSDTGAAVRYGYISSNGAAGDTNTLVGLPGNLQFKMYSKGTIKGASTDIFQEDDFNWNGSQYLSFIWVSANGLHNGEKIESAFLMWNAPLDGTNTLSLSTYFTVRLDTISADYRAIDGVSVGRETGYTDPNWLDMSWSFCDIGDGERWAPALNLRHDWHDFGPRARQEHSGAYGEYSPADRAAGTVFRFDVTDAVQQASDNGTLGRGLLFVIAGYGQPYPSGASDVMVCAGNHPAVGTAGKGCPTFTATATSRRGEPAWRGARVPIVLTFDDSKADHTLYMPIVRAAGLHFTGAHTANYFTAREDSLYAANVGYVDIIHHSKTHVSTGSLSGANLNAELAREVTYDVPPWSVRPDTSAIRSYAYPGDSAKPKYSLNALTTMMAYGFTSARCLWREAATSSIGIIAYPAWRRPANMMAMASDGPESLMCQPGVTPKAALTTTAAVREALYDAVDVAYTLDQSPITLYIHDRAADAVTPTVLQYLVNEVQASNCARLVNYYDMIEMRTAGARWMDPAEITNAYANAHFFSTLYAQLVASGGFTGAAKYDSLRSAAGTPQSVKDNLLHVWISGK